MSMFVNLNQDALIGWAVAAGCGVHGAGRASSGNKFAQFGAPVGISGFATAPAPIFQPLMAVSVNLVGTFLHDAATLKRAKSNILIQRTFACLGFILKN